MSGGVSEPPAAASPRQPWTDAEIAAVLDPYFEMLCLQLNGETFVKAEFRRRLETRLPARSRKAIELKWCNVSAILGEMGLPSVHGFAPLTNYQQRLRDAVVSRAVDDWLGQPHPSQVA